MADRITGRGWGQGLKSFAVTGKGTSAVTVEGKVDGYPIRMLVDTGSMVTLLWEDCWREVTSISGKELKQPVRSVVVANGEELDTAGQCEVTMSIGNFSFCYPVLVAKGLIQQCLLGADFLTHNGCVVDLQSGQMSVAGERVPLWPRQRDLSPLENCHVALLENTIVPPLQQVQLLVKVQTRASDTQWTVMVWLNLQQNSLTIMTCCWPGLYHHCTGGHSVIRLLIV